jgi:hypothetical protein
MATYVFAYTGGSMAQTDQEREAAMAAWGEWFGSLQDAVVDAGNPVGAAATVASDGSVSDGGKSGLTGYSILRAENLAAATTLAKGCPVLSSGGGLEVYEIIDVM